MAKKVTKQFKLMAPGGKATPAPPLGPVLGANGVNPGQFITKFNDLTKALNGRVVGCIVTVYADKSFSFVLKTPPASFLLKKAVGLKSGSKEPGKVGAGKIARSKVTEIATLKMKDLNANDIDAATRIIEGSARAMGLEVVEG
jgi:large subunit ribosomal protein L11